MSTGVFYRKYRPQQFSDLRGQEVLKQILVHSILNDSFSHGYLFCGPRGTGKTTTARLFARAINDPEFSKNKDLSNYIESSIDIIEMDAASNRGIDEIRELRENIHYLPAELSYKVYIIDEAHMLTKEAFNALLKTLEEPPAHVVFVLATTEPHKIPVTIMSRVTRFDFKLAEEETLLDKLDFIINQEKIKIEKDAMQKIFALSGGSFRDAESILSKVVNSVPGKSITAKEIDSVFGLLPQENLNQFADALESGDKETLRKLINEVNDEYIDFVVEGIIETLLNRESNPKYISMMLDIAKTLRNFRNKKLYILARIYSSEDNVSENSAEASLSVRKEKKSATQKQKEEAGEIKATKDFDDVELIKTIANSLEQEDKRLGVVFSTCQIKSRASGKLRLANPYQFNINYLSQKKNKDKIISECNEKGLDCNSVSFVHERDLAVESESLSEVYLNGDNDESDEKPNTAKKGEESEVDNSELIESFL